MTNTNHPDPEPDTIVNPQAAYHRNRRRTRHPFNFELDDSRRAQLRAVAQSRAISMGATLRQLIYTAHMMQCQHKPHCVSGRECFMPHIHPISPPQPPDEVNPR